MFGIDKWRQSGVLWVGVSGLACRDINPEDSASVACCEDFDLRWSDAEARPNSELSLGALRECVSPRDTVSYTESAELWGLQGGELNPDYASKAGVAVVHDFDGDGELDIVLGFEAEAPRLYRGSGTGFELEALPIDDSTLPVLGQLSITLVDLDEDGSLGLMAAGPPAWRMINQDGVFLESEHIPTTQGPSVMELLPMDLEADGDLDYFVVSDGYQTSSEAERQDYLIRVHGDLVDTPNAFESLNLPGAAGMGFDGLRLDWDLDGDLDVYVVNDRGPEFGGNVLWENRDGVMVDVTDDCDCGVIHSGMGVDRADFDRDGDADLYVTAVQHNVLYENLGNGRFADVATATGADTLQNDLLRMSWGAIFLDHDNDGLLDLLVSEGDQSYEGIQDTEPVIELTSDLARQTLVDGEPRFESIGAELGLDLPGFWRATVAMDFNHDGVLDLLITDVSDHPLLFLSDGCTSAGWIEIEAPMDSMVEIVTTSGSQTAWVSTESGWGGARSPVVHFGLGEDSEVLRLGVRTLDGEGWTWSDSIQGRRGLKVTSP